MFYYICGCDVAHFVILCLVNSALPCVSLVSVLRADNDPAGWWKPRNIWFRSRGGSASLEAPPPLNPLPPLDFATTLVECGRDGTQKHLSCASLQYRGSTDGVSKFADCSTEVEQVNGNALHCHCTL